VAKYKSLSRSALVVVSMTFISRIFGFARDMVIANLFGAGIGMDAFLVANKIPNFMRRLFAEGAFSQAFVPVLSEYRKTRDATSVKQFVDHMSGMLAIVLLAVTVVGVVCAPILVFVFAPGFVHHAERYELSMTMLRFTFPYLLFISLTALSGAILNSYDRFGVPAFTPVLLNLCLIGAAILLAPHFSQPIVALAVGVCVAGVVQLLFQFPFLLQIKMLPIPRPSLADPGVRKVLKLMVPALFGVSVSQINLMMDQWFASFLKVGSISWLYYSDRITQLPLGMFGVAIATVILPSLSRQHAGKDTADYSKTLDWGIRSVLLIGSPAMVGIAVLAGPILASLFQYGHFSANDVYMARQSLWAFSGGLMAFMLIKVFASGFYAKQNIKLPVRIGMIAMVSNTLLSLCLIWTLFHAGLALATSLSAVLNAGLLLYFLLKKQIYTPLPGWLKFFAQIIVANVAMAVLVLWLSPDVSVWLREDWHWRVLHLSMYVAAGIFAYVIALVCLGVRKLPRP
jgi:putative peptidoglycan lipid II flippase